MPQQFKISGNNTTIRGNADQTLIITLHHTDIVTITPKQIILNTGGWFTNTTKTRMQQVSHQFNLGYNVFQKKGSWFVDFKGIEKPFNTDKITLER